MTTAEQIKILCIRMNISMAELARRIKQSPQNFSAKIKRGTLTEKDLKEIADVLGVTYEQSFILANGEKIKVKNGGSN